MLFFFSETQFGIAHAHSAGGDEFASNGLIQTDVDHITVSDDQESGARATRTPRADDR